MLGSALCHHAASHSVRCVSVRGSQRERLLGHDISLSAGSGQVRAQELGESDSGPKRRRLQAQRDLVQEVASGALTAQLLERKLHEHVESVDADMVRTHTLQHCCDATPVAHVLDFRVVPALPWAAPTYAVRLASSCAASTEAFRLLTVHLCCRCWSFSCSKASAKALCATCSWCLRARSTRTPGRSTASACRCACCSSGLRAKSRRRCALRSQTQA